MYSPRRGREQAAAHSAGALWGPVMLFLLPAVCPGRAVGADAELGEQTHCQMETRWGDFCVSC